MLLERRHRYDPSKARPDAFVTMVVEHAAADIIRRLMAKKRESKRNTIQLQSLAESGHGEASQRGETISQRQQDSLRGVSPRSTEDQAQLEQDIADVLSRLSPDLRDLAERLKEQLIAQAARERGVPRSTLMHRVRQLRRRFEKAGLHHYLEPSSSTRA